MKKVLISLICALGIFCAISHNVKALFNPLQTTEPFIKVMIKKISENMEPAPIKKISYPTKRGFILVTKDCYKDLLPIGHAALVINHDYVYEATAAGVVRGLNNWDKTKKHFYGLKVKNVSKQGISRVMNYVKKQLHKKYNFNYFDINTRDRFYCSQLIYAAFKDTLNINLDTPFLGQAGVDKIAAIYPMELTRSNNVEILYYQ